MQDVSKEFTSITGDRVDERFQSALRDIAGLLGAGCGAISLLDESGTKLRLTWRWAGSEFGPTPFPETPFPPGDLQRKMLELLGIAQIGSVAELPDDFADTRERLLRSGFRSLVNIGMFARGQLIGVLGFGSAVEGKIWPPELHRLMEIAGELFTNVIERLRSEEKSRNHRDKLAHALRLGTMGQLAAGIAHELNQPLSAIVSFARGCIRRLSEDGIDPEQLRDALEKITGQAMRAAGIIRTLRDLVRANNHLSNENVFDVLNNAFQLIEPEYLAANIRLDLDADPELPAVQIDRIQIEQVLLNLLKNAYDALLSASLDGRREVRVKAQRSGAGTVDIAVADTGPGVDPAQAEAIFEDFHSSKPDGLGLGLSISRAIVEAHGGRLWLDNSTDGGACFHFTLPVAGPLAAA
jgi:signal transduction histidine kinase